MPLSGLVDAAAFPEPTTYVVDNHRGPRVAAVIPRSGDVPRQPQLQARVHEMLRVAGVDVGCRPDRLSNGSERACTLRYEASCPGDADLPQFLRPLTDAAVAERRALLVVGCGTYDLRQTRSAPGLDGLDWDELEPALVALGLRVEHAGGGLVVVVPPGGR